ncbi:MAG: lysophospholipase [Nitrospirota bacterium]|nr:lysophospholipase [Nitrospirota bacterium]
MTPSRPTPSSPTPSGPPAGSPATNPRAPLSPREVDFSLRRDDGLTLRGRFLPGGGMLIVFMSGFRSVHYGDKARAIAAWAAENGHACLRYDHIGHGDSDGDFEDYRVSRGMADNAAAIQAVRGAGQPLLVVGSSMGGWMALESARTGLIDPVALLLIAPPTDFFSRRMATMPPELARQFKAEGFLEMDDRYRPGTRYRLTQGFLLDAIMMETPKGRLILPCPVTIVHGSEDESVPIATGRSLHQQIGPDQCRLVEIPGGDHRLGAHMPVILDELARLVPAA